MTAKRVEDWGIGNGRVARWHADPQGGLATCRACGKSYGVDLGNAGTFCPSCHFSGRVSDETTDKVRFDAGEIFGRGALGTDDRPSGLPLFRETLLRRFLCVLCGHAWAYPETGRQTCKTCGAVVVGEAGECIAIGSGRVAP